MADNIGQLLLRDVPPALKKALVDAAEYAGSNMQAIAVAILAEEFRVPYVPKHVKGTIPIGDNLTLNLRMPDTLHKKIRVRAAEQGIAHSDLAITILADKLGVEVPPEFLNRRRGRRKIVAA